MISISLFLQEETINKHLRQSSYSEISGCQRRFEAKHTHTSNTFIRDEISSLAQTSQVCCCHSSPLAYTVAFVKKLVYIQTEAGAFSHSIKFRGIWEHYGQTPRRLHENGIREFFILDSAVQDAKAICGHFLSTSKSWKSHAGIPHF